MSRKRKSPPDYRADYFKEHEGRRIPFRKERCYKCVECGKWFPKSQITIDHRIPIRKGGTHDIWNLQTMCRPCNLHKSKNETRGEFYKTLISAAKHHQLGKALKFLWKRKVKDVLGKGYDRDAEGW